LVSFRHRIGILQKEAALSGLQALQGLHIAQRGTAQETALHA